MTTFYASATFAHKATAKKTKNIVIILRAVVDREPTLLLISVNIMR